MDKQKATGALFIDLKKAFDLVDHECRIYKLQSVTLKFGTLTSEHYLQMQLCKIQMKTPLCISNVATCAR